jgi:hypothetical protein
MDPSVAHLGEPGRKREGVVAAVGHLREVAVQQTDGMAVEDIHRRDDLGLAL